jgi:hypothetical protein
VTEHRHRAAAVGTVCVPLLLCSTLAITGCQSDVGCVPPVLVIEIDGLVPTDPHRIEVDTDRNNLVLVCDDVGEGCGADGDPYRALLTPDSEPGVYYLSIIDDTRRGRAPEHGNVVIENLLDEVEYVASFTPQPTTHGLGCESALEHWQLID